MRQVYDSLEVSNVVSYLQTDCMSISSLFRHDFFIFLSFSLPAPPTIASLERTAEISSVFTLSCVSTQSPATTVTWSRDGVSLSSDSTYRMAQILVNRAAATYHNQLSIDTGPYGTTGNYSCSVSNFLGSDSANIAINGQCVVIQKSFIHIYHVGLDLFQQVCR